MSGNKNLLALILIIPIVLNLLVTFYNVSSPPELGLPFFYWFQIVLLPLSAVFYLVYAYLYGEDS